MKITELKLKYEDTIHCIGSPESFNKRKDTKVPFNKNEIKDATNIVIEQKNSIIGGLGGFANQKEAGEIVMCEQGKLLKIRLKNGKHKVTEDKANSIYPILVLTTRQKSEKIQTYYRIEFEEGESVKAGIEEITKKHPDSSISGTVRGTFMLISGYIFTKAFPKTELHEFEIKEERELFVYQYYLSKGNKDFVAQKVHQHGITKDQKEGYHVYDAKVKKAVAMIGVASKVLKH